MPNPYFQFKQFVVFHDRCGMKVGTDGVLLGAWAQVERASSLLDIGTGSGLIALMLAQRNPNAWIDAVELDEKAAEQALENVERSPWSRRIDVHRSTIQTFQQEKETRRYDHIVSNPPFFLRSLKAKDKAKQMAKHTDSLPLSDLLGSCARLLAAEGQVSLIFPAQEGPFLLKEAAKVGLFLHRCCEVFPTPTKPCHRWLVELSQRETNDVEYSQLCIELGERHVYSKEYQELTRSFYLKF